MSTNERHGSETRYGHGQTSAGGGRDDQGERKDDGWQSRQGGGQSRATGSGGEPRARRAGEPAPGSQERPRGQGTNTQGDLAGVGDAADRSVEGLEHEGFDVDRGEIPDAGEHSPHRRG